ncbi:MAG: rod shape-determining protein MreC [Acidimicrobiia bacterium]|nr:rod shape-determining protein MreC [Acidimicrobiia bacterium]
MWRPSGIDRSTATFIGLVLLSLVMVTIDLRASGEGLGGTLRDGVQTAFTPVQKAATFVTRPVVGFFEGLSDLVGIRDENRRLRLQVADLERQLAETESLQRRVEELEEILAIEPPGELDTVAARVLATGPSDFDAIRLIDKGRRDGITVDMPVIDEGGLVGRVVAVTETSARVRLITDPTMRVAVRVERTGETGILTGRGGGLLQLEMFNTQAALIEGDLLVTADGRFPAGIPVARVTEKAEAEVGFSLITRAAPEAELSRVDYVKVLVFTSDQVGAPGSEEEEEPVQPPLENGGTETTVGTGTGPGTTLSP